MPDTSRTHPPYLEIAAHLRRRIETGELRPGDPVPSQRQLAAKWGVSRPTAVRALGHLRGQGLVRAVRGSGTRVASAHPVPAVDELQEVNDRIQRCAKGFDLDPDLRAALDDLDRMLNGT